MDIAILLEGAPSSSFDACPYSTPQDMMKWARDNGLVAKPKRGRPKNKPKDDKPKDDDKPKEDDDKRPPPPDEDEPMEDFEPGKIDRARRFLRPLVEAGKKLPTHAALAEQIGGLSERSVRVALLAERARLEGIAEGRSLAKEEKFTKAQQADVQRVLKVHARELQGLMIARQQELEAAFEQRVATELQKRIAVAFPALEAMKKEAADKMRIYNDFVSRKKPILNETQYNDLIFCTHWDQRKALTEERANRAFAMIQDKKVYLTI
jgi:hypothetical protein